MDLKEIKPNNALQNNSNLNNGSPLDFFHSSPNKLDIYSRDKEVKDTVKSDKITTANNSIVVPSSSTQPPLQSIPPSSSINFIIPRPASLYTQSRPQPELKESPIQQKDKSIKEMPPSNKQIKKDDVINEELDDSLDQEQQYFSPDEYEDQVAVKPSKKMDKNKGKNTKTDNSKQKIKTPISSIEARKESPNEQKEPEPIKTNVTSTTALYTVDPVMGEMTAALNLLQQDLGPIIDKKTTKKKNLLEESIQNRENNIPNSINEILDKISAIDPNIEASALVANDGTIVASAISRRINDNLISTIVTSLGLISIDVIHSLEGGELESLALSGTKGTLFISPIMKNIFLILYTNPDVKMGIISITKTMVKKQIELFFAKKNLQKTPV